MSRVNITQPLPLAHRATDRDGAGRRRGLVLQLLRGLLPGHAQRRSGRARSTSRASTRSIPTSSSSRSTSKRCSARATARSSARTSPKERGWKIGDRIPLGSAVWRRKDGAESWDFEIVGSYRSPSGRVPTNELWINYAYFDEARAGGNGTVTLYFVKIANRARAAEISESIDALFANSTFETQTQSEKDWVRAQIAQIGDIGFFVNAIIARRDVRAVVRDGQHDDAIGARAYTRARGVEDLWLQQFCGRRASSSRSRCCSAASRQRSASALPLRYRRRCSASSARAA